MQAVKTVLARVDSLYLILYVQPVCLCVDLCSYHWETNLLVVVNVSKSLINGDVFHTLQ